MSLAAFVAAATMAASPAPAPQPAVGHVFTIVLENKDYAKTFGGAGSGSPYLGQDLPARGALLTNYYGTGHLSLDNYISMVSGVAPNIITQSDCQNFQEFIGGPVGADGQAVGQGCVYPKETKTVADQLTAKGFRYRGYMQDMGADPAREAATCAHPAVNAQDKTQKATAADQYATRHNPFVYFHSIIDDQAKCDRDVVNLEELPKDLESVQTTPAYSFITPDLCADGHDDECVNPEQKGGYEGIDEFLREWVPKITDSPAYKADGLLIVTFDEAEDDATACCDMPSGPNTPSPGIQGPGGGKIGAVLLSPTIKPGTVVETPMNHYGYLRSVEDLYGLDHLGYAGKDGTMTFQDTGVFNAPGGNAANPLPVAKPVRRFTVKRRGKRLVIRVSLKPGVVGHLAIRRRGKTVRRYTTGGAATFRLKVRRPAVVTLRAAGVRRVKRR